MEHTDKPRHIFTHLMMIAFGFLINWNIFKEPQSLKFAITFFGLAMITLIPGE